MSVVCVWCMSVVHECGVCVVHECGAVWCSVVQRGVWDEKEESSRD